jgi:hypothetical protein
VTVTSLPRSATRLPRVPLDDDGEEINNILYENVCIYSGRPKNTHNVYELHKQSAIVEYRFYPRISSTYYPLVTHTHTHIHGATIWLIYILYVPKGMFRIKKKKCIKNVIIN